MINSVPKITLIVNIKYTFSDSVFSLTSKYFLISNSQHRKNFNNKQTNKKKIGEKSFSFQLKIMEMLEILTF